MDFPSFVGSAFVAFVRTSCSFVAKGLVVHVTVLGLKKGACGAELEFLWLLEGDA